MFMLQTLLNWQDNEHMYLLQDILQTHQVAEAVADKNMHGVYLLKLGVSPLTSWLYRLICLVSPHASYLYRPNESSFSSCFLIISS